MQPDSDPRPKPINARNLVWWAARTFAWDRRRYRGHGGLPSARGIAATLRPNLGAPIFIVGADRSGTTFLGDCLAAVPQISYHHEPEAIKAAARHVYEKEWSYRRARLFFRTVYGWLLRAHFDGHLRFAEKTPTNSFIVPFLARAFPDAVFIHIVRDGRDGTVSHLRQPWLLAASLSTGRREPGGYRHGPDARFWVEPARRREFETASDVHRCIWSWRRHTESALSGGRDLPAQRYHELRYEDLVTDPSAEGQRLLDFLEIRGASSRTALLDALATADSSSVGGWRAAFGGDELATIEIEAGALLRRLGYA
ncbi:sulfotransferase [soil metagenome]